MEYESIIIYINIDIIMWTESLQNPNDVYNWISSLHNYYKTLTKSLKDDTYGLQNWFYIMHNHHTN